MGGQGVVWSCEDARGPQHRLLQTAKRGVQCVKGDRGLPNDHRSPTTVMGVQQGGSAGGLTGGLTGGFSRGFSRGSHRGGVGVFLTCSWARRAAPRRAPPGICAAAPARGRPGRRRWRRWSRRRLAPPRRGPCRPPRPTPEAKKGVAKGSRRGHEGVTKGSQRGRKGAAKGSQRGHKGVTKGPQRGRKGVDLQLQDTLRAGFGPTTSRIADVPSAISGSF
eukprot:1184726-Prorocentrum_minimum.AAC.1